MSFSKDKAIPIYRICKIFLYETFNNILQNGLHIQLSN
jgi:hypothetical protein